MQANQSQTENPATSKDELPPKLSNDHNVISDLVSEAVSVASDDKNEVFWKEFNFLKKVDRF